MDTEHTDGVVSHNLFVIEEWIPLEETYRTTKNQFSIKKIQKDFGKKIEPILYASVSADEVKYALKFFDTWFREHYKEAPEILEEYEKFDRFPFDIVQMEEEFLKDKAMNQNVWDILVRHNQNVSAACGVLNEKLIEYPSLKFKVSSGFRVLSPFRKETKQKFHVLQLSGTYKDVDRFIQKYGHRN